MLKIIDTNGNIVQVIPGLSHTALADKDADGHTQYVLHTDVDDTPVNGVTDDPISSNWAYDHEAAADPHTVYSLDSEVIKKDGSVAFTGEQSMGTNKLTNVVDPVADQDAATKKYADDAIDTDITTHAALPTVHQDAPALIAVHSALDTGVHGVGARHVAETSVQDLDLASHASRHEMAGSDQIHSMTDDDDDTGIEVEQSADEDKIHMKTAGTECLLLSAVGIQTLAKQSSCLVERATSAQVMPSGSYNKVSFNSEHFDIQNEFNSATKTGTADATEANKLHDADGGFTAGDVGKTVWNTTDNTYTTVSAYVDSGELTLTDDIMVNGEVYELFSSRFTVIEPGIYMVSCGLLWETFVDQGVDIIRILKNGAEVFRHVHRASSTGDFTSVILGIVQCASANDYIQVDVYQVTGSNRSLDENAGRTTLHIAKLA